MTVLIFHDLGVKATGVAKPVRKDEFRHVSSNLLFAPKQGILPQGAAHITLCNCCCSLVELHYFSKPKQPSGRQVQH